MRASTAISDLAPIVLARTVTRRVGRHSSGGHAQKAVLLVIYAFENEPLLLDQIAGHAGCSRPTAWRALECLIDQGWVIPGRRISCGRGGQGPCPYEINWPALEAAGDPKLVVLRESRQPSGGWTAAEQMARDAAGEIQG